MHVTAWKKSTLLLLAKTRMLDMRLEETSDIDALEKEFFQDLGSLTY